MRLIQSVLVLILSMTTFIHFAAAENEDTSNQLEMLSHTMTRKTKLHLSYRTVVHG
jgi:hypothetical protein